MILPQQLGMAEYIMKTVRDFDAKSRIFREEIKPFLHVCVPNVLCIDDDRFYLNELQKQSKV